MDTKEMIQKAKEVAHDDNLRRKSYGIMHDILVEEVSASGKNYYEAQMWVEHEASVKKAIRDETDKAVKKALEGLLL